MGRNGAARRLAMRLCPAVDYCAGSDRQSIEYTSSPLAVRPIGWHGKEARPAAGAEAAEGAVGETGAVAGAGDVTAAGDGAAGGLASGALAAGGA